MSNILSRQPLTPQIAHDAGGILICAAPDTAALRASVRQAIRALVAIRPGEPMPDVGLLGTEVAPGGLGSHFSLRPSLLPRAPLDAVEAQLLVDWASVTLVLVPVLCSGANGALAAVRSLMPRWKRDYVDSQTLGVVFMDSPTRPGSTPGGGFLHAKGREAVECLLAAGLDGFHGAVIGREAGTGRMTEFENPPVELLAWRFQKPEAVPPEGWKHLQVPTAYSEWQKRHTISEGY